MPIASCRSSCNPMEVIDPVGGPAIGGPASRHFPGAVQVPLSHNLSQAPLFLRPLYRDMDMGKLAALTLRVFMAQFLTVDIASHLRNTIRVNPVVSFCTVVIPLAQLAVKVAPLFLNTPST